MKKLTAAGLNWEQVNEAFDEAVDQAFEIVKKFGVSRIQIEKDMEILKKEFAKPGCNSEELTKAFIDGLWHIFNDGF